MTLPEKCRMLLEASKKATPRLVEPGDYFIYPTKTTNRDDAAFIACADPTTVQEICEAYLSLDEDDEKMQSIILKQDARIQELEAANAELAESLVYLSGSVSVTCDQLECHGDEYCDHCVLWNANNVAKEALAKARKVGG